MAVTLTKSYQKIATINLTYDKVYIYAKYTSQSSDTNKTTYYLKSTYYRSQGSLSTSSATSKLDGTSKSFGYTTFKSGETTLQEVSRTLSHNSDGSSPTKNVTASMTMTYGGKGSTSVDIKMPNITRNAIVTSATDFTDESNPSLIFVNPGNFTTKPYINISDDNGNLVYWLYRDEDVSSPYTWNITDEERIAMRKACNKQAKYNCTVGIDTFSGSTKIGYNALRQTMTIINANPTLTYTITEQNSKVIALLGENSESIVENASKVKVIVTPTALKEATIKSVGILYGNVGQMFTQEPYEKTFDILSTNEFVLRTYDSRMNYIIENVTKNLIPYKNVQINSCKFKRENPTSSNIILNANITYYQQTFGETANVPTIKYKVGEEGTLINIDPSNYTIDENNNKITISDLVLENTLDYRQQDNFYLYVNDLLSETTEYKLVTKGIPTFDAGEHDFQVNGDLFIADENRNNKINASEIIKASSNCIKARMTSNYTMINNTEAQTLNINHKIVESGDGRLTLSDKGVKIGKGVNHVLVSGQIYFYENVQTSGLVIGHIYLNSDQVITHNERFNGNYCHMTIPTALLEVNENDVITMRVENTNAKESIIQGTYDTGTFLNVKVID